MLMWLKDFFLKNRGTRQTLVKNIFWLGAGSIGGRLIRAVIIIYSARLLGAGEYGVFSYALGLAGLLAIFTDLGLDFILTREISREPSRGSTFFSTVFWMKVGLFLLTAILIIFILPYLSRVKGSEYLIPFIILFLIVDEVRNFCIAPFRAREKMEVEASINLLTNVAIVAISLAVLTFHPTARALFFSYIAGTVIGAVVGIFLLKEEFKKVTRGFDAKLILPFLKAGIAMALLGILSAFMLNTDAVMIGWWRGAEDIGLNAAAQRAVQIFYFLPVILSIALLPVAVKFIESGEKGKLKLLVENALRMSFLIASPLTIGGVILGGQIIQLLYGEGYTGSILTFKILTLTFLFSFPSTVIGNIAIAHGKQNQQAFLMTLSAVGNAVFNAFLIPSYGIVGSAASTVIAHAVYTIPSWIAVRRLNKFEIARHLFKMGTATLLMIFSLLLLKFVGAPVIINIFISAAVYFLCLFALKEEMIKEFKLLFARRNQLGN